MFDCCVVFVVDCGLYWCGCCVDMCCVVGGNGCGWIVWYCDDVRIDCVFGCFCWCR